MFNESGAAHHSSQVTSAPISLLAVTVVVEAYMHAGH